MLDLLKDKLYKSLMLKFVNFLAFLHIKPNYLTAFGLLSGFTSAYFIYKHDYILAILFIILSGISDLCDGWLARITKQESKFGKIFDVTIDKYVEGAIGLSLIFVVQDLFLPGYIWVIAGTIGSILISVVSNSAAQVTDKKPLKLVSRFDRGIILILGLILAIFFGNIILTYTAIVLTILSHLTVITMLISYKNLLRKN